jgi:ethanolamine ammonia-lyase small subunit
MHCSWSPLHGASCTCSGSRIPTTEQHLQEGLLAAVEQEDQRRREVHAAVRDDGARQLQEHPAARGAVGRACIQPQIVKTVVVCC